MNIPVTFVAVFYDKAYPKNTYHAMYKRVNEKQWTNLLDGIDGKTVELRKNEEAKLEKYKVLEHRTFNMFSSVENVMYAVFDIEKLKPMTDIFHTSGNGK